MRKTNKQETPNEGAGIAMVEEWLTAQELAPRLKKSPSTIYSLVRRGTGIPYAQPPGTKIILFSWQSVNAWLHKLEGDKRRKNFED
jgi:excisionase family DNA binding protein